MNGIAGSRFELLICGYLISIDYEPAGMTLPKVVSGFPTPLTEKKFGGDIYALSNFGNN